MASKRHLRRKACEGKKRYARPSGANTHKRKLGLKDAEVMAVYKCQFCGGWHVGHKRKVD